MYQRSADLGLGIPFNIASYALLTHMSVPLSSSPSTLTPWAFRVAQVTNTDARELIIQLGDAHVYRDHVDALQVQLERAPKRFPTVRFAKDVKDIDEFVYEDIVVEGYESWPAIPMKMSV
jgi:thymidylate synthase